MNLTERINNELKLAMKANDTARKRTLRAIKAQFTLLDTSGKDVTDDMRIKSMQKMVKERQDSFDIYVAQSRFDLADPEMEEIDIINEFLPEQISEEELRNEISLICLGLNANSMKDMGKVMKEIRIKFPNADGRLSSTIVKELLS